MLKEAETEKKQRFVVIIFIIGGISIAGGAVYPAPPPVAKPMTR